MEKLKLIQVPVYLPENKHLKVKQMSAKKRLSMTKWIEEAIDVKIKKEDK